jgi:indole-3-glycerol phosphate synthase
MSTTLPVAPADVLAAIVAATRRSVDVRRAEEPAALLETRARDRQPRGDLFAQNLRATASERRPFNVIAECKRRSPSRGVLRADYDPVAIARSYADAGAGAISVLTEPSFFDGSLDHLQAVRAAVASVPVLRKDFIVDAYQLLEARAAGADAILLIVAALDDVGLRSLLHQAADHQLAALVEVHTADELTRAQEAGATLIGMNSRNLKTLSVSLDTLFALADQMDKSTTAVAESGIRTRADLVSLRAAGYAAFLVGERFMTDADPGAALTRLMCDVSQETEVSPSPLSPRPTKWGEG